MNHLTEEVLEFIATTNDSSELESIHLAECFACNSVLEEFTSLGTMLSDSFKMNEQKIDFKSAILNSIQANSESRDYSSYIIGIFFLISVPIIFYFYPVQLNSPSINLPSFNSIPFIQSNMNSITFSLVAIIVGFSFDKLVNHFREERLSH